MMGCVATCTGVHHKRARQSPPLPIAALLVLLGSATSGNADLAAGPQATGVAAMALGPGNQSNECRFFFANSPLNFTACQSMAAELDWPYDVFWSVEDPGKGLNLTLKGAIAVAAYPGIPSAIHWAGFGFPAAGQTGMFGGSAIIVKACSSCASGASVDSYFLGGFEPEFVLPPGQLDGLSMDAAFSGGRLQAVFELSLAQDAAQLTSLTNALFSAGPLGPTGGLQFHTYYTTGTLELSTGLAQSLGPAIAPSAATPQISTAAFPPSTVVGEGTPSLSPSAAACGLSFAGTPASFAACQSWQAELFWDYNLLWSVKDGESGSSVMRAAIDVATFDVPSAIQWAGFGFPAVGQTGMVGGSAIIIKACSSCPSGASVDQYFLGGQIAEVVQPPGHLNMTNAAAALSHGRLQAVFQLALPLSGVQLAEPVPSLFAAGPLDASGGLLHHTTRVAGNLSLEEGLVTSLGSELGPSSLPYNATAAPPPAIAPAPGPGDCSLEFAYNNSRLAFAQCQSLTTASSANTGYRLLWNTAPSTVGNGSVMIGALEASSTGWAGFGIPSTPGSMPGANALIVKPCATCTTGASVDNYYLAGTSVSQVVAGTGKLNVSGLQAAKSSSGALQALFTLYLPPSADALSSPLNLIAAVGPVDGSNNLQAHPIENAYSGQISLATGSLSLVISDSSSDIKPTVHGYLMIFGWGLLIPFGLVFARCKEWGPIWFHLHRATQMLGYLVGIAGAGVGVSWGRPNGTQLEQVHRIIGLVVTILLSIQVLAVIWRPSPQHHYRFIFNYYHCFMGGAAILLACANVFIGLNIAGEPTKWSGLYAAAFGLIVIIWGGKAILTTTRKARRASPM